MKYGTSGADPLLSFEAGYAQQVADLGAEVGYLYGQDPRYSEFDGMPASHDLFLQTKATTRAAYDAMIASMPATRAGKVYLHYHNEPEDNIEDAELTMAQWQSRCDALFAAIAASGKTYIIPSIEIMYWTIQRSNKTPPDYGPTGAWNINNYLRPGLKHIIISAYAEKKVSNGHEVANTSPVNMPNTIGAFMATKPGLGWSLVTGWALGDAYADDPITRANRCDWFRTVAPNVKAKGCQHFTNFNRDWQIGPTPGDYRIETDPGLLAVWRELT